MDAAKRRTLLSFAAFCVLLTGQTALNAAPAPPSPTDRTRLKPVRTIHIYRPDDQQQNVMAITPDSRSILSFQERMSHEHHRVSKSSMEIDLWDIQTGRIVKRRPVKKPFQVAAYSPDGRFLATAYDSGEIRLSDAHGGRTIRRIHVRTDGIDGLYFSPDSRTLAAATLIAGSCADGDGPLLLFDVRTGQPRSRMYRGVFQHLSAVSAGENGMLTDDFAMHPDMHHFLFSTDAGLEIRSIQDPGQSRLLDFSQGFNAPAISADGRLAAAMFGNSLALWDLAQGKRLTCIHNIPADDVEALVAFSPDGHYLTVSCNNGDGGHPAYNIQVCQIWRVETPPHRSSAHNQSIGGL